MRTVYGKEGRLEERLSLCVKHVDICHCDEIFVLVEFILDALIPADVDPSAQQVHGRLNGGLHGYLGNDIRKDLALLVIFNGHIASYGLRGVPGGDSQTQAGTR